MKSSSKRELGATVLPLKGDLPMHFNKLLGVTLLSGSIAFGVMHAGAAPQRSDSNPFAGLRAIRQDGTVIHPQERPWANVKALFDEERIFVQNPKTPSTGHNLANEALAYLGGRPHHEELTQELFASKAVLLDRWTPTDSLADDGMLELVKLTEGDGKLSLRRPPWGAATARAPIYRNSIIINANWTRILETEKNCPLYLSDRYIVSSKDHRVNAVDIDPASYICARNPEGNPCLFFTMRSVTPLPLWYPDVAITLHVRQTLLPGGEIRSEWYSTSKSAIYLVGFDEMIPLMKDGRLVGTLVATTMAIDLADYDGTDDDDATRDRMMRQALGNWKRLSER